MISFFLEKIKEALLLNFKDIVDEIEVNIMNETLQKFKTIHDLQEDMKTFLPESGKSRSERAHNFLTFVFKHDEYVIELENVLRQNNIDHLLEVKGKMEGKRMKEFELNLIYKYLCYQPYVMGICQGHISKYRKSLVLQFFIYQFSFILLKTITQYPLKNKEYITLFHSCIGS